MKQIYLSLVVAFLFLGIVSTQYLSDQQRAKADYVEPMVLRPDLVKAVDLGLHNAAADLMWLGAIQYFGGRNDNGYPKMVDYLNFSSDLDPKFSYPYAFGSLVLPTIGQTNQGLALVDKAIKNKVDDWRVSYYAATTYLFEKNDKEMALKMFDLAASTPSAPDNIKRIAANFGSNKDKRSQTLDIWKGIYDNTKDEVIKERAKKYIIHFQLLDFLSLAADEYKKKYGKYPANEDELVTGKILKATPEDPFGFHYDFNEEGQPKARL